MDPNLPDDPDGYDPDAKTYWDFGFIKQGDINWDEGIFDLPKFQHYVNKSISIQLGVPQHYIFLKAD